MTMSIRDIAEQMLALLPGDGTPVRNREVRIALSRTLAVTVDDRHYLQARELLLKQGRLGLRRGQGGQIFRKKTASDIAISAAARQTQRWSESKLMPHLKKFLDGPFQEEDFLKDTTCIVYDTSSKGPSGIQWARPDFTLIGAKQLKLLPGSEIEVHSFELKTQFAKPDLAIYEALAQTRFTNFGHLVWHLPAGIPAERRLSDVKKQCHQKGLGFIRIREPQKLDTWEVMVQPVRQPTSATEIDEFLHARLDERQRNKIRGLINSGQP